MAAAAQYENRAGGGWRQARARIYATSWHTLPVDRVMKQVEAMQEGFATAGALYPAVGILLRPEWAALAMSASTVTVTINALLLNRVRFATGRRPVESSISQRGQE